MAEKAVRNKRPVDEAASLAATASSPCDKDSSRDPQGPLDTSMSPGPNSGGEAGAASTSKQKKKREGEKSHNPVVHQDYLERQLHIFQDQLISRLSVAFVQPPPRDVAPVQDTPPAPQANHSHPSPYLLLQLAPGPSGVIPVQGQASAPSSC